MARLFFIGLLTGVLLITGGMLLWYLAYGLDAAPADQVDIPGLLAPAAVQWSEQGVASIDASSEDDIYRALGYVHGQTRTWSVVLWRQAALGRLGEWFGEAALPVDRLVRRLGLGQAAQQAYQQLPPEEQALLGAYSQGLNAAIQSRPGRLRHELSVLGLVPEPWEPWHTLTLEHLFAWLATTPPTPEELQTLPQTVTAFFEADTQLRTWLQVHGFENSTAWAIRSDTDVHFFQRHVYGATALPFFEEVMIHQAGRSPTAAATLPGTPFFPAGRNDTFSWALLLTSTARLERAAWDPARLDLSHERITTRDGTEYLLPTPRLDDGLPLIDVDARPAPDTVWVLRWNGLQAQSDWPSWKSLAAGAPQPFRLLRGDGLQVFTDGTWAVLGSPAVRAQLPNGIFIGTTRWANYTAELLGTQEPSQINLQEWIDDAYSVWAAQLAPLLMSQFTGYTPSTTAVAEALTYLRNWDFSYDRMSIAASIFDTWMQNYRQATGTLLMPDSTMQIHPLHVAALETAVIDLTQRYGPALSQWRWETVRPERRLFPVWSADSLGPRSLRLRATARYAPLVLPGHGHPSALAWGPSPAQMTLPAPASWEAWISTATWEDFTIRRRYIDPNAPLGRYLISDRPPLAFSLTGSSSEGSTTLLLPSQ